MFKDIVDTKSDGNKVTVRHVWVVLKTIENCAIEEVNVQSEHLVLQIAEE